MLASACEASASAPPSLPGARFSLHAWQYEARIELLLLCSEPLLRIELLLLLRTELLPERGDLLPKREAVFQAGKELARHDVMRHRRAEQVLRPTRRRDDGALLSSSVRRQLSLAALAVLAARVVVHKATEKSIHTFAVLLWAHDIPFLEPPHACLQMRFATER